MAISIDWASKVITVPKADTTLVDLGPPEIRSLDVDQFRKDCNALQASEEGIWADTTHTHNPPVTVGGITLARVVEFINGYTITFENGAYAVNLTNANNNISDVTNLNTVSIRSANSAGLIEGDISDQIVEGTYTVQDVMRVLFAVLGGKVSGVTTTTETFRDPDDTVNRVVTTLDVNGNRTAVTFNLT